jgi:hypothetical protein
MLEKFGDVEMNSRKYDEATEHFSTTLSLNPVDCAEILIERSDTLRSSLPDLSLVMRPHKWFNALPSPSLSSCRLQLPGIVFRLAELDHTSGPDPVMNLVYHAMASALGDIKTKTVDDLTWRSDLYLVHPWICPLFDQEHSGGAATLDETTQALWFVARLEVSRVEYRRVATDSLIMFPVDNVRTIEVLPLMEV